MEDISALIITWRKRHAFVGFRFERDGKKTPVYQRIDRFDTPERRRAKR